MKNKKGFSLIEVLVFVSILGIFFITAAAIVTESLRTAKTNERRIIASHYAEELLEWIRAEKDFDWNTFLADRVSLGEGKWCMNQEELTGWGEINEPCPESSTKIRGIYDRNLIMTSNGEQVEIQISVSWEEFGKVNKSDLNSIVTQFD